MPEADESTEKGFLEILTEIKWVEKRWVDTRYEIEKGKEIEVPSMVFKTEDAMKGIEIAEKTLELSRKFLESYFEVKIPKKAEELKKMIKSEFWDENKPEIEKKINARKKSNANRIERCLLHQFITL